MKSERMPQRESALFAGRKPALEIFPLDFSEEDWERGSSPTSSPSSPVTRPLSSREREINARKSFFTPDERDELLEFGKNILLEEEKAVAAQREALDEDFCAAVSLLYSCAGNVILSGIGKAGLIAQKISATLASTGTPSHFLHPAEAIHGDLGKIRREDLILLLSNSGETDEILKILPSIQRFGIPILAMTKRGSSLAEASDLVLNLSVDHEADPLNLAPSNSAAAMLALGDALALAVSWKRSFRDEDFARFHPGGSLGRRLSAVEDAMRPLSECRVSSDTRTVREIFVESHIPGRRSGAILLVDNAGRLSGIFTDSDLAKLFERRDDLFLDRPVSELMTRSPQTIKKGVKMSEAVRLMGTKKISELPVLDDAGRPMGILDITDFAAFLPLDTLPAPSDNRYAQ